MIGAAILGTISSVLDKVIPDVNARKAAKEALAEAERQGELDLLLGQLSINRQEAAHKSLFVAGWRPAVGWVCVLAMGNNFLIIPYADAFFPNVMIQLDVAQMMPVLIGMLGLGGMRSYEKVRGVAREK